MCSTRGGPARAYVAAARRDWQAMQDHFTAAARRDPQHAVLIRNVQAARAWYAKGGPDRGLPLDLVARCDLVADGAVVAARRAASAAPWTDLVEPATSGLPQDGSRRARDICVAAGLVPPGREICIAAGLIPSGRDIGATPRQLLAVSRVAR
ncbi:hypothetical protein WMF18_19890 [Sorangium sp. So ce315]|uniref:hypothetical protein n=1 Tax=Sorangium sp. So ce315 TaxID=3133299 RepID=UPI003F602D25